MNNKRQVVIAFAVLTIVLTAVYSVFVTTGPQSWHKQLLTPLLRQVVANAQMVRPAMPAIGSFRRQPHQTHSIWPELFDEHDRILEQNEFMYEYNRSLNGRVLPMLNILQVGGFNVYYPMGQEIFQNDKCPINRCQFVTDPTRAFDADAIFINSFGDGNREQLMPQRRPHQIWILHHSESPYHDRANTGSLRDLVNWTVTYRRDSTIVDPYFKYAPAHTATQPSTLVNYALGKTKMVAWMVSNCSPPNGRGNYVNVLRKYISIDIFGGCGSVGCPREGNDSCHNRFRRDYKFYLSFENSNCRDYITEKVHYQALGNSIIPIVMGARPQDYAAVMPAGSYINVDDFAGPRELAAYLHVLDKNDTLYNEYFRWKTTVRALRWEEHRPFCRLCAMLHYRNETNCYVHHYPDYREWWNGNDSCRHPMNGLPWSRWTTMNATSGS